nr:integrase, catalytic region, zinc finger, CCHC-type, peptidase aspartic, catalytic [Tanacetum cinerariifolium]
MANFPRLQELAFAANSTTLTDAMSVNERRLFIADLQAFGGVLVLQSLVQIWDLVTNGQNGMATHSYIYVAKVLRFGSAFWFCVLLIEDDSLVLPREDSGKENEVNILKSIDEGPFQMGTVREPLAEGTEGAPHLGPEHPRVYSDLSPEEKDRYNADI